ncbi:coiled-coil domain-containing protein 171 [Megalobrama amblycephala]|uniref:coiled-coil domain-containing protein 171 n=1 Tax=Megalobrama amblycephala TaxID=75352 RepID=UPI0020143F75|nr:coiled-coil domain-containing protein 171 [Megalobrama amblycephala]XP_048035175.1 coiled-coil domain-containing protein 171 [Megalobrama amblycephala]XP_048035176.1 coiled-coil domain-containing protein 171 [Megalobrama amblycephala]
MPTDLRPRHGSRAKRKDSSRPDSTLRASHPSALTPQEEINRLRDVIDGLQRDRRVGERETSDDFTLAAELRWKINQLEKDKLDFTSKHNEEVSQYEAQVARLRAQVERGEAQRQTLEYDVAVVRRDAAAERRNAEEKMKELRKHNHRLDVLSSELHQRVSDLQRSLEITQQAREDDLQGLQTELHERDRLLLSANAENDQLQAEKRQLETLIQEQNDTLHKLKCEMERMKRGGEKDAEKLKHKSAELNRSAEREQRLRSDLESAMQKVKDLEQSVESERTAHLQSKFSSEIIQMRMRDLEGALEVEKKGHAEVTASLELWKQKFEEVERLNAHERDKSHDMSQKLAQLEKDFLTMKTDLIGQLDHEKAASAELIGQLEQERVESVKLSVKLQEQEKVWTERQHEHSRVQEALVCMQESYDSLLSDIDQVLQQYQQQGATHTHNTGEGCKHDASALMDILRRTLHYYNTQLQDSVIVMQKLNDEVRQKDETITDLQRNIQECEARGVCVSEEVKRLRACVTDAAAELRRLTQQHTQIHTQMNTLRQQHHKDCQEKLAFLHTLYQRLIAGCVLVTPPHSMLGSFSWTELSALVQEHVDTLTSDLSAANQKVSCLEGKSAALESVNAQLRQREESWVKQREDLNTHYTHLNHQLQLKIQDLSRQLEQSEGRVHSLERTRAEQEQEVMHLQCLWAACGLLAGCVRALRRQVCLLAWQKAALQERMSDADALKTEVSKLLHALGEGGVKGHARFRRCAIAVLAAGRLRTLGRSSAVMFRVAVGSGPQVCVSEVKLREEEEEENGSRVMKTLRSTALLRLAHTCMEEVQGEMSRTDAAGVMSAAQSGCRKLLERLLSDVDSQCCGHYGKDSLARRLRDGLHAQHTKHSFCNSKMMMASLQKHILEFTQRLHSAEVERRNLRLELSHIKRTNAGRDTHTACAPLQQFERVCEELSSALQREQRAQALLHDQASQLQQLGLSMELHTGEELEKDRTLAQAVQSLSDAKMELRRKDQSLRSLGKQLSQSQQENKQLQQNIISAENALYTAAKNRESLMSYMKSVEKEMNVILSKRAPSQDDFTLQLYRMTLIPSDSQSIMGNPEREACQRLVMRFLELNQLACSKIPSQERRISSYESHIPALKDACLRDKPFSSCEPPAEVDCGTCPSDAAVALKGSSRNTLSDLTRERKH